MTLALESDLRTVFGEVARGHGYERLKEEYLSAFEKFVSGQDIFVSLPTASIAKHTQRCTHVLLDRQACCVRSPTTCYNTTSGCKALWGEPDKMPFVSICIYMLAFACDSVLSPWFVRNRYRRRRPVSHLQALQLVSPAGSCVTPASRPVCYIQFHWPLYCRKHASE